MVYSEKVAPSTVAGTNEGELDAASEAVIDAMTSLRENELFIYS